MALNLYTAEQIQPRSATYLLYAKPGAGKTSTIQYLPGKTAVLDIDKTSNVLKGKKNILIIDIDVMNILESINEAVTWLIKNSDKYDNIVIDNVSELQSCILSAYGEAGKNDGVPSQGDYQKYQFKLLNLLKKFKGLNKTVLLTAWEELVEITAPTGEQYTCFMPKIQKGIRDSVCGLCNVVGHLEFTSEGERAIRLETTKNVYAKNQVDDRKGCLQKDLFIGGKE